MPAMIQGYRPDPRIRQTQLAELRRVYGEVVKQQGAIVFLAGEEGSGRQCRITPAGYKEAFHAHPC